MKSNFIQAECCTIFRAPRFAITFPVAAITIGVTYWSTVNPYTLLLRIGAIGAPNFWASTVSQLVDLQRRSHYHPRGRCR